MENKKRKKWKWDKVMENGKIFWSERIIWREMREWQRKIFKLLRVLLTLFHSDPTFWTLNLLKSFVVLYLMTTNLLFFGLSIFKPVCGTLDHQSNVWSVTLPPFRSLLKLCHFSFVTVLFCFFKTLHLN